jgi:hypothetical protein
MKNIKNMLCLGAASSLILLVTACGPSTTNSSNSSNVTDTSALDTGKQYGQQPRDSSSTNGAVSDTAKKTGTNGNADPSGRLKNK